MKWLNAIILAMMLATGDLLGGSIREFILGDLESAELDTIDFKVTNVVDGKKLDILNQTSLMINYAIRKNGKVILSYVKGDVVGAFSFVHVPVCPNIKKLTEHTKPDDIIHVLGKAHNRNRTATVSEWAFFSKIKDGYQVCFLVVHSTRAGDIVGFRYGEGGFSE